MTSMPALRIDGWYFNLISGCIYVYIIIVYADKPPMYLSGHAILLSTSDRNYYRSSSRFYDGHFDVSLHENGRVEVSATARRCAVAYEVYDHNGLLDEGEEYGTEPCPIFRQNPEENGTLFGPAGRRLVVYMRDVWEGAMEVGAYTHNAYERPYDPTSLPEHTYRMIEYSRSDIGSPGHPAVLSCRYVRDDTTSIRVSVLETTWYRLRDVVPSPVQRHLGLNVPIKEMVCKTGGPFSAAAENGNYTCEHRGDVTGGFSTLRVKYLSNETVGNYTCRIHTAFHSEESIVPLKPVVKIRVLPIVYGLVCGIRPAQDPSAIATLTAPDGCSERTVSPRSRYTFHEETFYTFELSSIFVGNYTCTVKHLSRSVSGTVMITDAPEKANVLYTIAILCFCGVYLVISLTITYIIFR